MKIKVRRALDTCRLNRRWLSLIEIESSALVFSQQPSGDSRCRSRSECIVAARGLSRSSGEAAEHIPADTVRRSDHPIARQAGAVREHLPGVLNEHPQQLVFLGRKLHLLIADLDDPPNEIDGKIADAEDRALTMRLKLMPERRPHPG